jgi:hypothetical protein
MRITLVVEVAEENVEQFLSDVDDRFEEWDTVEGYEMTKSKEVEASYDTSLDPISPYFDIHKFIYG